MKISTLLHRAADEFLPVEVSRRSEGYSCIAFWDATQAAVISGEITRQEQYDIDARFEKGMEALGLNWGSFHAFDDVPLDTRQAARYQWLKFCALLAEEQGE